MSECKHEIPSSALTFVLTACYNNLSAYCPQAFSLSCSPAAEALCYWIRKPNKHTSVPAQQWGNISITVKRKQLFLHRAVPEQACSVIFCDRVKNINWLSLSHFNACSGHNSNQLLWLPVYCLHFTVFSCKYLTLCFCIEVSFSGLLSCMKAVRCVFLTMTDL